jgi:hypothetical protein
MSYDQATDLSKKVDMLLFTQNNLNYFTFREIFGEAMGEHLWEKWDNCNANVLNFTTLLDQENLHKLMEWTIKSYGK